MKEEIYQNLAESLANLFAPQAQVALYGKDQQLLAVFNRLTNDSAKIAPSKHPVRCLINKNQSAKAIHIPLEKGYFLELIVDLSQFEQVHRLLQNYLGKEERETTDWQTSVDQIIQEYTVEHHTTISALQSKEKRALILSLHEKNFFRYQDATKYLAAKLNVSRATIYNYLNQASELKTLEVHQVDSFTDEPFSGNPAGVVLEGEHLNEAMMKKIAREMNLSETAFLLPSKKADLKLRYFTPTGSEVIFCGHSTVGALYMLAHKKMFGIDKPGRYELSVEANIGIISSAITLKADESVIIEFQAPKVELVASKITHSQIAEALGIPVEAIDTKKPICFEKNNKDLYVTIASLKQLGKLQIDQRSAKQFAQKHGIVVFALVCNETLSKGAHIHMRCFAPAVGIPEDPFTGSVLGGLATYIKKNHLIDARIKLVRVEQGHFISRPGVVDLRIDSDPPIVIAKARHFFSTEMNL